MAIENSSIANPVTIDKPPIQAFITQKHPSPPPHECCHHRDRYDQCTPWRKNIEKAGKEKEKEFVWIINECHSPVTRKPCPMAFSITAKLFSIM